MWGLVGMRILSQWLWAGQVVTRIYASSGPVVGGLSTLKLFYLHGVMDGGQLCSLTTTPVYACLTFSVPCMCHWLQISWKWEVTAANLGGRGPEGKPQGDAITVDNLRTIILKVSLLFILSLQTLSVIKHPSPLRQVPPFTSIPWVCQWEEHRRTKWGGIFWQNKIVAVVLILKKWLSSFS